MPAVHSSTVCSDSSLPKKQESLPAIMSASPLSQSQPQYANAKENFSSTYHQGRSSKLRRPSSWRQHAPHGNILYQRWINLAPLNQRLERTNQQIRCWCILKPSFSAFRKCCAKTCCYDDLQETIISSLPRQLDQKNGGGEGLTSSGFFCNNFALAEETSPPVGAMLLFDPARWPETWFRRFWASHRIPCQPRSLSTSHSSPHSPADILCDFDSFV